ncbi:MAG: hypothetical protein K2M96_11015 [Prevotella sp.]|nr:hypothetical protein [Prevotella sp.]
MAQLSTIISSILRDMVNAQHQTNLYTIALKDMYGPNGQLDKFSLPAVALGEMELCIQYGITDSSSAVGLCELNPPALLDATKNVSNACAQLLLDSAISTFNNMMPDNIPEDAKNLITLEKNTEKWNDFSAFLGHKIQETLQRESTTIIKKDGSIDEAALLQIVLYVGEEFLLDHKEVQEILDRHINTDYNEQVKAAMMAAIEKELPGLLRDVNAKRKQSIPSVDVCVSSEELAALPNSAIHTFRLQVSPNNINMYLRDE